MSNQENNKEIILTGVRPTGVLTIANYLGAMKPIIELQKQGAVPYVFVADLHAFTDNEPSKVKQYVNELVADYVALGLDPEKAIIYTQTHIKGQVTTLMTYLARLITVNELLRVPTLKDKIKDNKKAETVNALLLLYPVLMAADILIQRSTVIPVGKDQVAHIEVSKLLAERFNSRYGNVFPVPKVHQYKSLRIMSLKGEGKMSKSMPEGAIFLTDTPEDVAKKIKKAQTAFAGEMSDSLESLIHIAEGLAENEEEIKEIRDIVERHMKGDNVMGEMKPKVIEIVTNFLIKFQKKRADVLCDTNLVSSILHKGGKIAVAGANETVFETEKAMFNENSDNE